MNEVELTPPRQRRSRKTLDRLVEACEGLLQEKPFEEISVADIARRGRSSVGAFYGRFKGKDALLHFLDAKRERLIVSSWESYFSKAKWEGVSTEEILRQFVTLSVRAQREKKGCSVLSSCASGDSRRKKCSFAPGGSTVPWSRLFETFS